MLAWPYLDEPPSNRAGAEPMKSQEVVSLLERFPELFDTDDELLEELTSDMHVSRDADEDVPIGKARAEAENWELRHPR